MSITNSRVIEPDVAAAVLRFLEASPSGEASLEQLKAALPGYLNLGTEDRAPSRIRQGEQAWEQQLRHLVNHRLKPGNAIHDGLLSFTDGHIVLTTSGRQMTGMSSRDT